MVQLKRPDNATKISSEYLTRERWMRPHFCFTWQLKSNSHQSPCWVGRWSYWARKSDYVCAEVGLACELVKLRTRGRSSQLRANLCLNCADTGMQNINEYKVCNIHPAYFTNLFFAVLCTNLHNNLRTITWAFRGRLQTIMAQITSFWHYEVKGTQRKRYPINWPPWPHVT